MIICSESAPLKLIKSSEKHILKAHSAWLRMSETACGRFAGLRRKHGNVQRTGANTLTHSASIEALRYACDH